MSEQHTPGRLKNVKHSIYSDAGYSIAISLLTRSSLGEEHDEANARRLVACWNACDGIDTEDLEAGIVNIIDKLHDDAARRVMAQRDELLEVLKASADELARVEEVMMRECGIGVVNRLELIAARAAIAKAEGGAA